MTGQLAGKTAIVTGGASGIGLAITRLYLAEGAEVLAVDQQRFDAADLQASDKLALLLCDITAPDAAENIVEAALSRFSKIDILVNNAGITRDRSFRKMSLTEWQEVINTNLSSAFNMCSLVIPEMVEQKYGRIIPVFSL